MKKGVTMSVILIAVVIMLILVSSATVVGTTSMATANYEDFKSTISRLSNDVNEYYIKNNTLPIKNEVIDTNTLNESFKEELEKKGDLNRKLFIIDMTKINDATITIGRGASTSEDIFLVADDSHNIYYLKGHEFKKVIYYGV